MISPHYRTHLLFCVIKENSAGSITSLCFLSSSLEKAPDTLILMIGALGKYDFDVLGSSEVRVRHLGDHWLTLQGPQFSDFILEKKFGIWISFETRDTLTCVLCADLDPPSDQDSRIHGRYFEHTPRLCFTFHAIQVTWLRHILSFLDFPNA